MVWTDGTRGREKLRRAVPAPNLPTHTGSPDLGQSGQPGGPPCQGRPAPRVWYRQGWGPFLRERKGYPYGQLVGTRGIGRFSW
jgi:hypothetical protein